MLYSNIIQLILVLFTFTCPNPNDINHTFSDFGITQEPKIKKYNIQSILDVPDIKKYYSKDGKLFLIGYRTEYHNGSENGCILVLNNIQDGTLHPCLVIEELFYITNTHYFLRKVESISEKEIIISLNEFNQNKENKLLTLKYIRLNTGQYKELDHNILVKGNEDILHSCSEVYDNLKKKIMNGTY
jgi:hypothetical protein